MIRGLCWCSAVQTLEEGERKRERELWPYWNKDYWFSLFLYLVCITLCCSTMIIIIFSSSMSMHCDATDIYILPLLLLFSSPTMGRFIFIRQWTHYNIFYIADHLIAQFQSRPRKKRELLLRLMALLSSCCYSSNESEWGEKKAAWILTDRRHLNP